MKKIVKTQRFFELLGTLLGIAAHAEVDKSQFVGGFVTVLALAIAGFGCLVISEKQKKKAEECVRQKLKEVVARYTKGFQIKEVCPIYFKVAISDCTLMPKKWEQMEQEIAATMDNAKTLTGNTVFVDCYRKGCFK